MPRRLYLQPLVNRPTVVRWVHRTRCIRTPSARWSGAERRTVILGDGRGVWIVTLALVTRRHLRPGPAAERCVPPGGRCRPGPPDAPVPAPGGDRRPQHMHGSRLRRRGPATSVSMAAGVARTEAFGECRKGRARGRRRWRRPVPGPRARVFGGSGERKASRPIVPTSLWHRPKARRIFISKFGIRRRTSVAGSRPVIGSGHCATEAPPRRTANEKRRFPRVGTSGGRFGPGDGLRGRGK